MTLAQSNARYLVRSGSGPKHFSSITLANIFMDPRGSWQKAVHSSPADPGQDELASDSAYAYKQT